MFFRIAYVNGRWRPDRVEHWKLMGQLRDEAGIRDKKWPDDPEDYDRLLMVAGRHGIGLETGDDGFEKAVSDHMRWGCRET